MSKLSTGQGKAPAPSASAVSASAWQQAPEHRAQEWQRHAAAGAGGGGRRSGGPQPMIQTLVSKKRAKEKLIRQLLAASGTASLELPESRERLLETIQNVMGGGACSLLVLSEDQAEVLTLNGFQEKPYWTYNIDFIGGQGLVSECLREKATLLCNDASSLPQPLFLEAIPAYSIQSILCAPLVYNDQALGAVAVLNKRTGPFTARDQVLLEKAALGMARSVYYARLVQSLTVANADLEAQRWQLLNSRNTLRTLFDSIPTSIYIIDRDYKLCAINLHRADRTGAHPTSLVGQRCYEALFQLQDVCPGCQVFETLFTGRDTTRMKRQWEDDNEPLEWEINTYPINNEANQIIQAIVLEQDVTEKRRLEATLAQSEKLAAVGQLAAGIAHEINNPLTAILASAQLLHRELPEDDENQELVDLINQAGTRATQVVRNLLDLARKEHYDFAPTDLHETIRKSLELIQHEIMARSIQLTFEPCPDLPLVKASKDHLQGVWINFLTNAMDSIENGHRQIRITTRRQGNEIHVTIADSGKGIPPERLTRIFEPFYTTKSPGHGTGLGLSVCHRVVKQHGGRILVDSKIDKGTQFTVILPVS